MVNAVERGVPAVSDAEIEAAIMDAVRARGPDKTVCPSEPARLLHADWRALMPRVRAVAATLAASGRLRVTRKGVPVDPEAPGGPVRLSAPPDA